MNPRLQKKLIKLIPYPVVFGVGAFMYVIIELGLLGPLRIYPGSENPYDPYFTFRATPLLGVIMGLTVGIVEEMVLPRILKFKPFFLRVGLKSALHIIILLTVFVISIFPVNAFLTGFPLFSAELTATVWSFISTFAFWSILIFASSFIFVVLFVSATIDNLGIQSIQNFFSGRYSKAHQEERIFMFLDMKSSTTIAEELGHERYYELLKRYYDDMTNAIIDFRGEVYQYVGDEIILSWPYDVGVEGLNCVDCFFAIEEALQAQAAGYRKDFGVFPQFKAGMHCGTTTTGEIGQVKKDILFTGDVLNTTSRIQSECNVLGVKFLISAELKQMLDAEGAARFDMIPRGVAELRGKSESVALFEVRKA